MTLSLKGLKISFLQQKKKGLKISLLLRLVDAHAVGVGLDDGLEK